MSGRRTSGSSRPRLGVHVLAGFSFISWGKSQFKKCLEKRPEVPDTLFPDIRGILRKVQERENRPKRKFSGRISRGRPVVNRADFPGQKLRAGPRNKNRHLGADIHDPNPRTSMTPEGCNKNFGQKNIGPIFRALKMPRYWSCQN